MPVVPRSPSTRIIRAIHPAKQYARHFFYNSDSGLYYVLER